ncbi:endolytic transglycosylase MltG [Streptomyces sp. ICBB 8177]|uniref:endolytic transglycosylase MltG n=1 Tax=Streptomyces sp. ICBB 8177 TaxID=563922 RepID=UPI000D67F8FE|nr:endolytic transglycosylase MltG [Streptomyces sp. ICBB 8177]PWI42093.1 hypothetical protein CK485_25370 [Streptomyces sp. ICBB 8177]
MTDYGQGHGSQPWHPEPWHPDDPLYGDPGWEHQQDPARDAYGQQGYPPESYPQQQYQPQYAEQQYPQQQWDGGQQYPAGQQYPVPQQYATAPQAYGWDQQVPYPDDQYGQYGTTVGPPADPYGNQPPAGYYDGNAAFVRPEQPQQVPQTQQFPQAQAQTRTAPPPAVDTTAEWNPFDEGADEPETHPFFTGGPSDTKKRRDAGLADAHDDFEDDRAGDGDDDGLPRRGKRGEKKRPKRRSGCACLVALIAIGGLLSGGGYLGYRYYEGHFAAPPDYAGQGSGSVQVQIPDHATLAQMGNILKTEGVVRSVDAFTKAAAANPQGSSIQGGIYELRKQMSAAAAVTMMLDPSAQSALIIPEGWRATQVYDALDKRLGLAAGSTATAAKNTDLGLPSYVQDGNPEGFLYPTRYSVGKGSKPGDVLKQMVQQAESQYAADNLPAQAAKVGKTPFQIIVIASLIQAEAQQQGDFGKVSRVIYNRLQQNMALGFDSTINYAKGRSTLNTTAADTQYQSPYNTYLHKGLPPGPIDNPGQEAIQAALNPAPGDWLYFVTVKPGDTRFTDSAAVQAQNVQAFNEYQREHGG